jgi:hypothetical protein
MSERCFVCGKEFEAGDKAASVVRAQVAEDGSFQPNKAWGHAHFSPCFERAVDSPQMVMDRLKRLAKEKPTKAIK